MTLGGERLRHSVALQVAGGERKRGGTSSLNTGEK